MREKKCRLFISIELSEEVRKEISKFLKKLKRSHWPVRWVALENIHITLAFLGWQKQEWEVRSGKWEVKTVELIRECVEKAIDGIGPFEVKIRGIGCFPDFKRPRVVWLGLAGDLKSLAKLQKRVLGELGEMGFKMKERKFIPHLTLGRVGREVGGVRGVGMGALRNLGDQISRMKVGEFDSRIVIEKVSLMESKLRRAGPIYKELASVKLKMTDG